MNTNLSPSKLTAELCVAFQEYYNFGNLGCKSTDSSLLYVLEINRSKLVYGVVQGHYVKVLKWLFSPQIFPILGRRTAGPSLINLSGLKEESSRRLT